MLYAAHKIFRSIDHSIEAQSSNIYRFDVFLMIEML